MIPYLHILIRVKDDGSLHAIGAFTSKEKQKAYQTAAELTDSQVRFDFHNGPFDENTKIIYAGHRSWNMNRFQLGGYFMSESESWTWVTQEGYVSALKIDSHYASQKALEEEVLERYAKLQKHWHLKLYSDLVTSQGVEKARASIMLRFYEDDLESFKPKARRNIRALYGLFVAIIALPLTILSLRSSNPEFGEDVATVNWLPDYTSNISFYRSRQVEVYEFRISPDKFKHWAAINHMQVQPIREKEILSRYKAYHPTSKLLQNSTSTVDALRPIEQLKASNYAISITIEEGLIAQSLGHSGATAVYAPKTETAYFQKIINF